MKARDKNRKAIPVFCATQRQCPRTAGSGGEEVGRGDMQSTPKMVRSGQVILSPAENRPKVQFKILGNMNHCI